MLSNKVEYSIDARVYCNTHDVKVLFLVPEVSGIKTINHRFHADNDKGESGTGYDMLIGGDLMVQLGLTVEFKHQFFQWDGATVHMKETRNLLGKYALTKF